MLVLWEVTFGLYWIITFYILAATSNDGPLIKTNSGIITGRHIKSYAGRVVSAFEGIPYAKPPVGPLRFQNAEPVSKWANILVANKTYTCIQPANNLTNIVIGTEDCLYLYIYVPRQTITGRENFDVVVGIHSGAFTHGDPHSLCGPGYLMDKDLIYVSMNYRLGVLGFLSTEDDAAAGNYGLKDQVLAFKWIKNNIKYFGGNPKSITLTGVSAGGASVHFHYLSPMSKGLFQQGYSVSGTALNSWVLTKKPAKKAKQLGKLFNCPQDPSKRLVECLREVDAKPLVAAISNFYPIEISLPITVFGPVIEKGKNSFLPDHPYNLLLNGKIKNVHWIASNTLNEGMFPVGPIVRYNRLETLNERWNDVIPPILDFSETVDKENQKIVSKKLREFYLKNETLSMNNIDRLIDLFGDRLFIQDIEKSIRLHAKMSKSPVYYYLFTYKLEMRASFPDKIYGISHMDDARLIFPVADNPDVLSAKDEKLKNMFIDFVHNFASGKKLKFGTSDWTPLQPKSRYKKLNYLHIDGPDSIQMDTINELTPTTFWASLPIKENDYLFKN